MARPVNREPQRALLSTQGDGLESPAFRLQAGEEVNSHRGTVHPSGFLPTTAGSVRRERLPDIYRTSPLFVGLRDPANLGGKCGACEFRTLCGGSRSRAFATSGDPYAAEPWCSYIPGTFPYQDELVAYGAVPPV